MAGQHRDIAGDDTAEQRYPLLSTEPLEISNPRRKARVISLAFALAIVLCSGTAAAIGNYLGNERTDRRIARLEADLAERRKTRATQDQATQAQIEQARRDTCVIIQRMPPPYRDAALDELRRRYDCGPFLPAPAGAPTATPSPGDRTSGGGGGSDTGPGAGGRPSRSLPTPRPTGPAGSSPAPTPAPGPTATSSPPASQPPLLQVCLPLVGCVVSV